jgi:hypothetical protein
MLKANMIIKIPKMYCSVVFDSMIKFKKKVKKARIKLSTIVIIESFITSISIKSFVIANEKPPIQKQKNKLDKQ